MMRNYNYLVKGERMIFICWNTSYMLEYFIYFIYVRYSAVLDTLTEELGKWDYNCVIKGKRSIKICDCQNI